MCIRKLSIQCDEEIDAIMWQLLGHTELWNQHTLRTHYTGSAHQSIHDIWLRYTDIHQNITQQNLIEELFNGKDVITYPALHTLYKVQPLLAKLMYLVEGERLGRVIIANLPGGAEISPHIDEGETCRYYDRFHVVLSGSSLFYAGNQMINAIIGDVFWFDNQKTHHVKNNTPYDRIHLIVDIKLHEYSPMWRLKSHHITSLQ